MKFESRALGVLLLSTIAAGQDPLTDRNIKDAVSQWFSNKQATIEKYGDIKDWDTSQVTDLSQLFNFYVQPGGTLFNDDISGWDTSSVTTVEYMFNGAQKFNQPIGRWDVSNVENFDFFLGYAPSFNQDLNGWKTGKAKTMGFMFMGAEKFNQYIGDWDVSSVEVFNGMFFGASAFNQGIYSWNTSSATTLSSMFYGASAFNSNIRLWDTSNVVNMDLMFMRATSYNQPMSQWDVSKVTSMKRCFSGASMFNQNINGWVVSSVTDMSHMFTDASNFQRTLCWRDMIEDAEVDDMFCGTAGRFHPQCTPPKVATSSRSSCAITESPTTSPAPSMSSPPSSSPTLSSAPTQTASPTMSVPPTNAPSISPTAEGETRAPVPNCGLDFTGYFGTERDKNKATKTDELVYYYQLTTNPKVNKAKAKQLVGQLEKKVAETMLPTLFQDSCATMQAKRNLKQPLGFHRDPKDEIVDGVACSQKSIMKAGTDVDSCYVVRGAFTIYSYVGDNLEDILKTSKEAIESGMDSGSYNFQTGDGISVRSQHRDTSTIPTMAPKPTVPPREYVLNPAPMDPVPTRAPGAQPANGSPSASPSSKDNDLSWMWALVGISGTLFLFYGILRMIRERNVRNYKMRNESNTEDQNREAPPSEDRSLSAVMEKDLYTDQREAFIDEPVIQPIESYEGELEDVRVEEPPETFDDEVDQMPPLEHVSDESDAIDCSEEDGAFESSGHQTEEEQLLPLETADDEIGEHQAPDIETPPPSNVSIVDNAGAGGTEDGNLGIC